MEVKEGFEAEMKTEKRDKVSQSCKTKPNKARTLNRSQRKSREGYEAKIRP